MKPLREIIGETVTHRFNRVSPSAFVRGRDSNKRKAFLSDNPASSLSKHKTVASPGGKVGYAMDRKNDLQNIHNSSTKSGLGKHALIHAIKNGAKTLDCFDGKLRELYHKHGFVETGRLKFNDEHAPANWNYEKHGRPDVVFMAYRGGSRHDIEKKVGKFPKANKAAYHKSYDEAKAKQHVEANKYETISKQRPVREDTMDIKFSAVMDKLPEEAQNWIKGLNSSQRYGLEVTLNNIGVEAFAECWEYHRQELKDFEFEFGRL